MYLRIEGYPSAEFLTKHNLPEEALFFQPPSVKRLPAAGLLTKVEIIATLAPLHFII